MTRCLIGNLDAEAELARLAAPDGAPARGLPEALLRRLAAAATLLRGLCRDDDLLSLPRPVPRERLAPVDGLARPRTVCEVPARGPHLAWCWTPSLQRFATDGRHGARAESSTGGPLHERLWLLPPSPPAVVQRLAHRAYLLELAEGLGLDRPGRRLVRSLDELARHLASEAAALASDGRWVLKPPYSAAGRGHITGWTTDLDDPAQVRRLERLFASAGCLLFEPWLERVDDWGVCGLVGEDGVELLGIHRQRVDDRGRFSGVDVVPSGGALPELQASEQGRLAEVALAVGQGLAIEGHRGPFGIDAWRHRDGSAVVLEPLGELNPRMTFGLVARALAERLCRPDDEPGRRVGLRLARATRAEVPGRAQVLLAPGDDDDLVAWMERVPEPADRRQRSS